MPKMAGGAMAPPELPDSAAIVRVDLATRKLDTAGFFKIAKQKMNMTAERKGHLDHDRDQPDAGRRRLGRAGRRFDRHRARAATITSIG